MSNREVQPGDLIEIPRGMYSHWAVYIGEGLIVHVAPPCEEPGAQVNSLASVACSNALVKQDRLKEVVGGDSWRVNNLLDGEYQPRHIEDIVREALALVGERRSYSLVNRNCEHFATGLRYGKQESRQVKNAQAVATAVTSLVMGSQPASVLDYMEAFGGMSVVDAALNMAVGERSTEAGRTLGESLGFLLGSYMNRQSPSSED